MTPAEVGRWSDALVLLSLDRSAPLFQALGLPPAVAASPDAIRTCARGALASGELRRADPADAERRIDAAIACIAQAYDAGVASAIRDWRTASERAGELLAWDHRLRRLCGLVSDEGSAPDLGTDICGCVVSELSLDAVAHDRSLLDEAHRQPPTEWEEILDERIHDAAGDDPTAIGVVDLTLDTAALLIRARRVERALNCLESLPADERTAVEAWAGAGWLDNAAATASLEQIRDPRQERAERQA
ncbi:MAG: hypothetical protein M3540_02405 [Actinomycetota bacterium]|nr:hypothetical protein [Actinomycetota bacterium]